MTAQVMPQDEKLLSFGPKITRSKIKKLEKKAHQLQEHMAEIMPAFSKLETSAANIKATISDIEEKSGEEASKMDEVEIDFEGADKYKEDLKATMKQSETGTIASLKELLEKAQKLRLNMRAANTSAAHMYALLQAQINVYGTARIQMDFLKKMMREVKDHDKKIAGLLKECEQINRVSPTKVHKLVGDAAPENKQGFFKLPNLGGDHV